MELTGLVDRVRSEFEEMPGLRLTIPQASRLWGLDPAACQRIVDTLVGNVFTDLAPLYQALREYGARGAREEIGAATA